MKELSSELLSSFVVANRKAKGITQIELSKLTGINRALISQLENKEFTPSANQLMALASILEFDINSVFAESKNNQNKTPKSYKIAVAGTGYVGL